MSTETAIQTTVEVTYDPTQPAPFSYSTNPVTIKAAGYIQYVLSTKASVRFIGASFLNPNDPDIGRIEIPLGGQSILIQDLFKNQSATISFYLVLEDSNNPGVPIVSPDPQVVNRPPGK